CDSSTGTLDATFTFSGGTAPYTVTGALTGSFEEGESTSIEVQSGGTATISVSDAGTCSDDFDFTFQECVKITECDLVIDVAELCDEDTGTLDVTFTFTGMKRVSIRATTVVSFGSPIFLSTIMFPVLAKAVSSSQSCE
ncbi:hypothetical protein N8482_01005, partial [Chitinophagales bacterium]|nr:hypothetical protein [Chitinophagales bacterium]